MKRKVLLVEDDDLIISGLRYVFEAEDFEVIESKNVQIAARTIAQHIFDLAVLDLTLPDGNGFEVFKIIKEKQPQTPVIFLTAVDDESNLVKGLEMGADDYLTKPFRVRELMARVKTILRRASAKSGDNFNQDEVLNLGKIKIFPAQGRVEKADQEIVLTAQEYRLLLLLAQNKGKILSRQQLLENLWDEQSEFVNDNTLTVFIKRLREKLEDPTSAEPKIIETVRGLGYRVGS